MNENQHQAQQQGELTQRQGVREQQQEVKQERHQCPSCGTPYTAADNFCPECGKSLKSHTCTRCGAATEPDWEICPKCGQNLHAECCSFCGATTEKEDIFCPECGNPKTGIICPSCHTLNFRSFCRKCNIPLNALAHAAMEKVRQNPQMQKAFALAEEIAQLEALLFPTGEKEIKGEKTKELSAENREFLQQYKELLAAFRGQTNSTPPDPTPQKIFSLSISDNEKALAQYNAKLEEMKETLNSLFPDADMTPQMQRDYYTAVKVEITVKTKVKVKIGWECNAYGCIHSQPNECSKPFRGGKWIYDYVEQDTQVWVKQ